MQKILFGKKLNENLVKSVLSEGVECHFVDLIAFDYLTIKAFDLTNKNLIFTSIQAVYAFETNGFNINDIKNVYCVGSKSKLKLESLGFSSVLCFNDSQNLANNLTKLKNNSEEFIYFKGNLSLDVIENQLSEKLMNIESIKTYQTKLLYPKLNSTYDFLVFFSPSGVESFAKHNSFSTEKIFALGQATANSLSKYTNKLVPYPPIAELTNLLNLIKIFT